MGKISVTIIDSAKQFQLRYLHRHLQFLKLPLNKKEIKCLCGMTTSEFDI